MDRVVGGTGRLVPTLFLHRAAEGWGWGAAFVSIGTPPTDYQGRELSSDSYSLALISKTVLPFGSIIEAIGVMNA